MRYLKVCFIVCFSLLCTGGFYYLLSAFENRKPLEVPIRALAQTGLMKEGLKTDHLAELLHLSVDKPQALLSKDAEEIIGTYPFIKKVFVSQLNPETLYIDYTLRTPLFSVVDIENGGLDEQGVLFPLSLFSPKKLPEIYLGLKNCPEWGVLPEREKISLALELMKHLGLATRRIDVSKIFEASLGKREVIVMLENGQTLRLTPSGYERELREYEKMKGVVQEGIIDLRIPNLAFICHD